MSPHNEIYEYLVHSVSIVKLDIRTHRKTLISFSKEFLKSRNWRHNYDSLLKRQRYSVNFIFFSGTVQGNHSLL